MRLPVNPAFTGRLGLCQAGRNASRVTGTGSTVTGPGKANNRKTPRALKCPSLQMSMARSSKGNPTKSYKIRRFSEMNPSLPAACGKGRTGRSCDFALGSWLTKLSVFQHNTSHFSARLSSPKSDPKGARRSPPRSKGKSAALGRAGFLPQAGKGKRANRSPLSLWGHVTGQAGSVALKNACKSPGNTHPASPWRKLHGRANSGVFASACRFGSIHGTFSGCGYCGSMKGGCHGGLVL